jgi:hypothetical protein
MWFKKVFCIRLIKFKASWQEIGLQELRTPIEHHIIHVQYQKMHLVSDISEPIPRIGSGDNFTTDMSERLHIGNAKEAYQFTNKVNYICQILKHNDRSTRLDYMEEIFSYLALQGCCDIQSAKVFSPLSAADKQRNTRTAIFYASSMVRTSHFSAPCNHRCII